MGKEVQRKIEWIADNRLFPLFLALYPLIKSWQGIDVTDTCYNLANMRFFPALSGTWAGASYLANLTGWLFMKLPFGGTMFGMNLYTGLLVSALALLVYFWYRKRMPAWLVFLGEALAIGLCWCPKVILYNYLTYFLFTAAVICLYEALTREKRGLLVLAGFLLGLGLFVRFPSNAVHTGLILAVWYDCYMKKKQVKEIAARTGLCVAGYAAGALPALLLMLLQFGPQGLLQLITDAFAMSSTAGDYALGAMVLSILSAYRVAVFRWGIYLLAGIAAGTAMFAVKKEKWLAAKGAVYGMGLLLLLRFFWGRGMFNFRYDTYESMFQWGMLFLVLSLLLFGGCLIKKTVQPRGRLWAFLLLLVILLTPLGSNNYTFPNLNNLFLIAPYTLWLLYRRWLHLKREPLHYPWMAMAGVLCGMLLLQSLGFGSRFVFRDSAGGEKRDTQIENCDILTGMYTNKQNAAELQGVVDYCNETGLTEGNRLLTYGTVPGMGYLLDMAPALSTQWADLDTYPYEQFEEDMGLVDAAQTVVLRGKRPEPVTDSDAAREQAARKEALLQRFLDENQYGLSYENEAFAIYERIGT